MGEERGLAAAASHALGAAGASSGAGGGDSGARGAAGASSGAGAGDSDAGAGTSCLGAAAASSSPGPGTSCLGAAAASSSAGAADADAGAGAVDSVVGAGGGVAAGAGGADVASAEGDPDLGAATGDPDAGKVTGEGPMGEASARRAWKAATGREWLGSSGLAELPEGMDQNTSFLLQIKLLGNRKHVRRDMRCYLIDKIVDSDMINIQDLIDSIAVSCPPGYLEVAHIQYYDHVMKSFPEVKTDQDLMSMFAKHSKEKIIDMFIGYCPISETYEPISEWQFDEPTQQENNIGNDSDDDDYLRNPVPGNEHVGVDEEGTYLDSEPTGALPLVVVRDKEKDKDYVPEDDSDDDSENEDGSDDEVEEDEELVGHESTHIPNVEYDKEDPPMVEGTTYPNMKEFKLALCMHAIKHEFEFKTEKSAPHRFRAYCSRKNSDKCPWKIYASTTEDRCTVEVRKNQCAHDCSSTRRKKKVRNATRHWISEKVKDFLIDDATLKAKALQKKIKERYKVHIHYKRVYMGRILALSELYGDWDSSFDNLFRFKAQIEACSPGSIVNIEHHTINGKIRFQRMFFALKPCIDGFLSGCRPYLAIDSTFLIGRFRGQLASASAVDGHNWLYPVCFGVFDSETNDNWIWFMRQLRVAIGSPRGLAICTDAGQAVMTGVGEVYPEAEKRECMFHLVSNFKKHYHGKVFDDNLWAAAYSWNIYLFEKHWVAMEKEKPAATNWLRQHHKRLWTRSQFSPICKVDYVTNNLAECLNNWIKHYKSLNLDDLMDKLRQLIMVKWNQRRKVAKKLDGMILPHIIKKLKEQSRDLNLEVLECSEEEAEVTAMGGSGFRFVVKLNERTCSCRKWQVSGIPCKHALAFTTSLPNAPIENYVDPYYSIDKFRAAYGQLVPALPDKNQWPKACHGFFMHPPLLKATAGRPKTERYKGCSENKKKKGMHQCPICKEYGHHWHNCKKGNPDDIKAMRAVRGPPKKKARTTKSAQSSIVPMEDDSPAPSMSFPPSQTLQTTSKKTGSSKAKHLDSISRTSICQNLETTGKTKGKHGNSDSGKSKRRISRSGSNQPDPISIELPPTTKQRAAPKKAKRAPKKIHVPQFDSPAMRTRSKKLDPASPAMGTRSKRRLSL